MMLIRKLLVARRHSTDGLGLSVRRRFVVFIGNLWFSFTDSTDIILLIQFNSIRVYLHANLTAQRPITKLAQIQRNTQK
jgi:hypothetical protein